MNCAIKTKLKSSTQLLVSDVSGREKKIASKKSNMNHTFWSERMVTFARNDSGRIARF